MSTCQKNFIDIRMTIVSIRYLDSQPDQYSLLLSNFFRVLKAESTHPWWYNINGILRLTCPGTLYLVTVITWTRILTWRVKRNLLIKSSITCLRCSVPFLEEIVLFFTTYYSRLVLNISKNFNCYLNWTWSIHASSSLLAELNTSYNYSCIQIVENVCVKAVKRWRSKIYFSWTKGSVGCPGRGRIVAKHWRRIGGEADDGVDLTCSLSFTVISFLVK